MLVIPFLIGGPDTSEVEMYTGETVVYKQVLHQGWNQSFRETSTCAIRTWIPCAKSFVRWRMISKPPRAGFLQKLEHMSETFWEENTA